MRNFSSVIFSWPKLFVAFALFGAIKLVDVSYRTVLLLFQVPRGLNEIN
jgi:hypothetical protein